MVTARASCCEPATDCRPAKLNVTPRARQQETWAKLPARHWRRVEFRVAPAADLRQPRVDRAPPNQGLRLKSVSVLRSRVGRQIAPATRTALPMFRAPQLQSVQPARVFWSPVRQRSIVSPVQSVFARSLCSCRSTRSSSALWRLHRANPSASSAGFGRVAVRRYRRAARGRLSQQRVRQTKPSIAPRRATSKTARAIALVVGFVRCRPFQFTSFKDSMSRGSRTGNSEVFPTMRRKAKASVEPMAMSATKSHKLT